MSDSIVIIPTYNEKESVERIIRGVFSVVPEVYIKVIDDNSPDNTAMVVEKIMKEVPHLSLLKRQKKNGLGKAYINGFDGAKDIRAIIMQAKTPNEAEKIIDGFTKTLI